VTAIAVSPRAAPGLRTVGAFRATQVAYFAAVMITLTGVERFFAFWSTPLHYLFDALIVGLCVAYAVLSRPDRTSITYRLLPLFFVEVLWIWGVAASAAPGDVVGRATSAMLIAVIALAASGGCLHGRDDLRRLAKAAEFAAIISVAVIVFELIDPSLQGFLATSRESALANFDYSARPGGLWINPNTGAIMLGLLMALSFWSHSGARGRWVRAACVVGVFLTGSREAFLPVLSIGTVEAALWYRTRRRSFRPGTELLVIAGAALAIAIAVPVVMLTVGTAPSVRALDLGGSDTNISYNPSRAYLFAQYWPVALDNPWYGGGAFTFQGNGTLEVLGSHNYYLTIFGECGLLMLVVYLVLAGSGFRASLSRRLLTADRVRLSVLWSFWLFLGLFNYNEASDLVFLIYFCLLFALPQALRQPSHDTRTASP
jgi:hypothetical protein